MIELAGNHFASIPWVAENMIRWKEIIVASCLVPHLPC